MLVRLAEDVSLRAHSPYSKVQVGAALLARDGRVFLGCNVENASYGLTICAERSAIVQAVAAGAIEFTAIAITTNKARALMPCGACRQVLHEFAPRLRIIVAGRDGRSESTTLDRLLPSAFGPRDLD